MWLGDGYQILDSVWGTVPGVPIDADAFSMIGGLLVAKKSRKIAFQILFGILGLLWQVLWPWLWRMMSMFWSWLGWLWLGLRFLGWLWLLLQFSAACCGFCMLFCDFSCFEVFWCLLLLQYVLSFCCRVLSFYCPFLPIMFKILSVWQFCLPSCQFCLLANSVCQFCLPARQFCLLANSALRVSACQFCLPAYDS